MCAKFLFAIANTGNWSLKFLRAGIKFHGKHCIECVKFWTKMHSFIMTYLFVLHCWLVFDVHRLFSNVQTIRPKLWLHSLTYSTSICLPNWHSCGRLSFDTICPVYRKTYQNHRLNLMLHSLLNYIKYPCDRCRQVEFFHHFQLLSHLLMVLFKINLNNKKKSVSSNLRFDKFSHRTQCYQA